MPNKFVGHGPYHYAKGGEVRRELKFMEDKGAPKSMIAAEKKEHGIGKKFADGGVTEGPNANIDDDTRARARAMIEARNKPPPEQAPPEAAAQAPAPRPRPRPARPPQASYSNEGRDGARPAPQTPPITPERAAAAEAIASAMSPERAQLQKVIAEAAHIAAIQDSMRKANAAPAAAAAPQARQQPYMPAAPSNQIPGMRQAPGMAAGGSIDGCATRGKTRA